MQTNSYNQTDSALGQNGSIFISGTAAANPNAGRHFKAITFITPTVFASIHLFGLVSNSSDNATRATTTSGETGVDMSFNSSNGGELGTGGSSTGTITFPAGVTIYGKWIQIKLASGAVVAYLD